MIDIQKQINKRETDIDGTRMNDISINTGEAPNNTSRTSNRKGQTAPHDLTRDIHT